MLLINDNLTPDLTLTFSFALFCSRWYSPRPELPTRVLVFRVFLRGVALLDAPVPLPVFALYLLPYGSPVSGKGYNQSMGGMLFGVSGILLF